MRKYTKKALTAKIQEISNHFTSNGKKHDNSLLLFCENFIQDSDSNEIDRYSPPVLAGHIQSAFKLLQKRAYGKSLVRVFGLDKNHGEVVGRSVVEIINDDMPFLVDSVVQFLAESDIEILDFFHPIYRVKRDKEGNFLSFCNVDESNEGLTESIIQIHIPFLPNKTAEQELEDCLKSILQEIRKATGDWQVMMRRLDSIISDFTINPVPIEQNQLMEITSFLRWLGNNHFTFLGFREYRYDKKGKLKQLKDNGLGLFRDPDYFVLRQNDDYVDVIDELSEIGKSGQPITIIKSNRKTNVHRFAHMDQIFVSIFEQGNIVGQYCFIGLFTSSAYNARTNNIPLLAQKVHEIIKRSGFRPVGHDGKTLTHILDTYPRDELFQTDIDTLYNIVMGIMKVEIRPTIRLFSRTDRFERFVTAMVYIPRERLNTDARRTVGKLLSHAFGGRLSTFSLWFGDNNYVRIQYIIAVTPKTLKKPDFSALEAEIKRITANWRDSVREALYGEVNDTKIGYYIDKFADSFPQSYRETHSPSETVRDIKILEEMIEKKDIVPHIISGGMQNKNILVRLFSPYGALPLSDCLPIFENFGFRVYSENPHKILIDDKEYYLHEFSNENITSHEIDLENVKDLLSEGFLDVYNKRTENDWLNKLIITAGLSARHVSVLRAFSRYLKQTGISYSQKRIGECLVKHAGISSKLYEIFDVLHNPSRQLNIDARKETAENIKLQIIDSLKNVKTLDEDIIIRRMMNVIFSVLRTNKFQKHDYFSFKLDCSKLQSLPLPRPYREIWVYSPTVEGVHLRYGKVARGGLRWSDRREDFRTEILGLVKAQQVKNAVIVPVGAKGGFFVKNLPNVSKFGREKWQEVGIDGYKTFISALLDITDNIVSEKVISPKDVVCYDDDDPYLVVAADKGTATFSDIANDLAISRNFWLGDAFASGGSNGYDHKKMGITARGAWEAVKRHFRELGKDIQTEDFTVIGVGDMSGDVFGNGMLLSKKINLVAAFDHRDIYIDPNPVDASKHYNERKRIFEMARSSWQDYDASLISKGGGIFSRSSKSIDLSDEIKKLTDLQEDKVTPNELISALLKSKADLLWFGGIGTYVKSDSETNSMVGDKANDAVRINGKDLNVKVIGEGANLGVTQKGRIEFALKGGAVNTDAVDNSAGVNCSDHEVNIKIALNHVMSSGKIKQKARDKILEDMTDEVADLVLENNYSQTQALTVTKNGSADRLQIHSRFIDYLEANADLNRELEDIPSEKQIFAGREGKKGLTRPELSVVMSYSKLSLYKNILATSLPDEECLDDIVLKYMPKPIEKYNISLMSHPLKREIITTVITNNAINEGGISFIFRICERLNVNTEQAMRAYLAAREIMNIDGYLNDISILDNKIPTSLQIKFHEILRRSLFDQTRRILVSFPGKIDIDEVVKKYSSEFQYLCNNIEKTLGNVISNQFKEFMNEHLHKNLPDDLCKRICALYFLKNGCDAIDLADMTGRDATKMTKLYFGVVEMVNMDVLRRKATEIPLSDVYDQKALSQIITKMDTAMYDLVACIAQAEQTPKSWFDQHEYRLRKYKATLNDAVAVNVLGLSRLSIIASALRELSI